MVWWRQTHDRDERVTSSSQWTSHVRLSRFSFCVTWWLVVAYHFFSAAFIFFMAAVHLFISQPSVHDNLWLIRIPRGTLAAAGWSFLALALVHVGSLLQLLIHILRNRRLTFGHDFLYSSSNQSTLDAELKGPPIVAVVAKRGSVARTFSQFEYYFGQYGIFGVHGKFFHLTFALRQTLEILLQTFQAYQISRSVPRQWINELTVALIALNCAFSVVVDVVTRHKPQAARRVIVLIIDLLLESFMAVGIPVLVTYPHALEFDWSTRLYPDTLVYNELWLTTAVSEARLVMVSSYLDLASSIFPHVAGLMGIDTLKWLIQRTSSPSIASIVPQATIKQEPNNDRRANRHARIVQTLNMFSCIWGVSVVALHFISIQRPSRLQASSLLCGVHLNAWLASNLSCAVSQVSCPRHDTSGDATALSTVLNQLDRETLTKVVFSHCHTLEIPSMLQEFTMLQGIELFNSTLASWPPTAAVHSRVFPHLLQLQLLSTNLTTLPPAFLVTDLPRGLNIVIFKSNLSVLPISIGDDWASHTWPTVRIESTQLRHLPPSFKRLRINRLFLTGNDLDMLDEDIFASMGLEQLRVSNNRALASLPSTMGDISALSVLLVENTSVSVVPPWVMSWWSSRSDRNLSSVVSFKGSPVCGEPTQPHACGDTTAADRDAFRFDLIAQQRPL